MSLICPTILAENIGEYRNQLNKVIPFAKRIQIDLKDGIFAVGDCVKLNEIYLPEGIISDLHIMYQSPDLYLEDIIRIKPNMAIIHAESNSDIPVFASELRAKGIKTGLAVLQDTEVSDVDYLLPHVQHVLIFSGNLGHFGGVADMNLLHKVTEFKKINPKLEFGWDGGVNFENSKILADGGIDVLNVGGAIQKSDNPELSYNQLCQILT